MMKIWRIVKRLRSDDAGVALVEFAIALPVLLLFLALMVEGGRSFYAYQSAIAGVRDATRYMSDAVPMDVCSRSGNLTSYRQKVSDIVRNSVSGEVLFASQISDQNPSQVAVTSVTPSLACVAGNFRISPAPVVTVTARLSIAYPFSGLFALVGSDLPRVDTVISDTARIFGT